jgi:hypothetical protein
MRILFPLLILGAFVSGNPARAQDNDLEKLLEEESGPQFNTSRIISSQSVEQVKAGTLDFRVTHRFGNVGAGSAGGGHTLFGLDEASDIRISFDYGLTENFALGIGRSKRKENLDGNFKWKILHQTTDNKIPFTLSLFSVATFTPMRESQLYLGVDSTFERKTAHRMAYTTQILLARKFSSWLSLQLTPGYTHRNFVKEDYNPNNQAADENGFASLGIGGRIKITKRSSILFDYFHLFSKYRQNNDNFFAPLSLGIEIETGGHVFHLNFSNSSGIIENDFLPYTQSDWLAGGFKFGFNISRVFTVVKPKM